MTASPRLLILGADAGVMAQLFAEAGFTVSDAIGDSGAGGCSAANGCDLIVIDAGSPAPAGLAIVQRLRDAGVLTAILVIADCGDDEVAALHAGADDFVTRPIDVSDLLARARAIVRRCQPAPPVAIATGLGDLRIDPTVGAAHVRGHQLRLTGKQFELLAILARRPGQIITRDALHHQLYATGDLPVISVIDVFVHGIRQQLAAMQSVAKLICVRGVGFCLVTSAVPTLG